MTTTEMFARLASIVREQHSRTEASPAVRGAPEHQTMTDTELDAQLTIVEKRFIDGMDTRHTDPATHADLADAMRAALATYIESINRYDTVTGHRDRALAACDVGRQRSYAQTLCLFPECGDLLAALDVVEHEARLVEAATYGDAGDYVRCVGDAAAAATAAGGVCHVGEREAHDYTLFLVALAPYTRLRSNLPEDGPELDNAATAIVRLATRIDRCRENMAAAAARARRRPGSSGPGSRVSVSTSSV